jgi:hypothetical protein
MDLDDFDEQPVSLQPAPTRAEIELSQTESIRAHGALRDLIVSPEVAKALRSGWSVQEIADVLNVPASAVYKYLKSGEMHVMIDRESRRVLRHLASRPLKTEKYRDLVLSVGVLIDKARLLRDEPTDIVRHEEGALDRLAILLFPTQQPAEGGTPSGPIIEITPESGSDGISELHEVVGESGSAESGGSPSSGSESGSEG